MHSSLSLLPPLIVLICSFWTKRIIFSLCMGIVSAALLISNFSIPLAVKTIIGHLIDQIESSNLYIFTFLTALGIIITLLRYTGGTNAYATILKGKIKSARSAQSASILLSCLFLFDDFFSSITTGCIMQPITDTFNIPRAKLAFLIDAMASPLVILVPISSWIAMLTMQLSKSGISPIAQANTLLLGDPFTLYLHIIPYIFYSYIIMVSVIFIVRNNISFGLMKKQETIAQTTQNVFGGKEPIQQGQMCSANSGSIFDFIVPITTLLIAVFSAVLYAGNYSLFGGTHSFIEALQHTDIFYALFLGSIITLCLTIVFFLIRKKIVPSSLPTLLGQGSMVMASSIVILFLAWTFSSMIITDLNTGAYIAQLLTGTIPLALLPALFFVFAAITSISIGSSWGTIAVLAPLITPMVITLFNISEPTNALSIPMLLPLFGAIFAGAVAGDHVSPLSSTTVMSSTSAGCYHLDHVKTQFQYALPAFIGTTIAFLITGLCIIYFSGCWIISISMGLIVSVCLLHFLNKKAIKTL